MELAINGEQFTPTLETSFGKKEVLNFHDSKNQEYWIEIYPKSPTKLPSKLAKSYSQTQSVFMEFKIFTISKKKKYLQASPSMLTSFNTPAKLTMGPTKNGNNFSIKATPKFR